MNYSVAPIVEPLKLREVGGGIAVLTAPAEAIAAARARKGAIEEALGRAIGRPIRVELRADPAGPSSAEASADHLPDTAARAEAMKNPIVRRAVELFDARIISVEDDTESPIAPPAP